MKNEGGQEAGKCSEVVPDRADWCLLIFVWSRCLFCNIFLYPVCIAQSIGDWYENRRGAWNTIILLIIRQYHWRTNAPSANSNGGPNTKKKLLAHRAWSALPFGRGRGTSVRQYTGAPMHPTPLLLAHFKEGLRIVRCPSPIFIPIAY